MGFFDKLLGRTPPVQPHLDQLFALTDASLSIEAALGYRPTGVGSVCYRAVEGGAFSEMQTEVQALLDSDDGPAVERTVDEFGYTWLTCRHDPNDTAGLVTELHAVNSTLQDQGFGPALLCSLMAFAKPTGETLALVYLYKRGTFYPFAPLPGQRRDNAVELQVRGALTDDLAIESELGRWFPVWGAPGL